MLQCYILLWLEVGGHTSFLPRGGRHTQSRSLGAARSDLHLDTGAAQPRFYAGPAHIQQLTDTHTHSAGQVYGSQLAGHNSSPAPPLQSSSNSSQCRSILHFSRSHIGSQGFQLSKFIIIGAQYHHLTTFSPNERLPLVILSTFQKDQEIIF